MNPNGQQPGPAETGETGPPARLECLGVKYLAAVAALLVVIIALLGVLWIRERAAHIAAERQLSALRMRHDQLQAVVGQLLVPAQSPGLQPGEGVAPLNGSSTNAGQ